MGVLQNVMGLLQGSGKCAEPVHFDPGEVEIARVVGCTVRAGGKPWVGGDLILTNQRLLFAPLNTKDVGALVRYGLKVSGVTGAGAVIGWMQKQIRHEATGLAGIASVSASRSGGHLIHPPAMVVELTDGKRLEFGVLNSRLSPTRAQANVAVRDAFVSRVQTVLR